VMTPRRTLPAVAALTFIAGFAVAELTGVRALGGLVLVATAVLVVIALALFVLSHPLGHAIGAWPAVVVSASLAALAAAR